MNELNNDFVLGVEYDFHNKLKSIEDHESTMINRLCSMFDFKGFPKTIDTKQMFKHLIIKGSMGFFKKDGQLYCRPGGAGGPLDNNFLPTIYTIASPALNIAEKYDIGKDCEVIYSDSMHRGLFPLLNKYATMLAENELSIYQATINTRMPFVISATDDDTVQSVNVFLDDIKRGKLGCILDGDFIERLSVQPVNGGDNLLGALTERQIFLEGKFWNDIGLNANWNSKREALASEEVGVNSECLLPLIDDMYFQLKAGCKRVNKLFGTSLSIDWSSSWKDREEAKASELKNYAEKETNNDKQDNNIK